MAGHINSLFITPDTTFKLVKATQFVAYQSILSWSFSWPLSNVNAKGKGKDSLPIFICLLFIMDFWFITLCFCDMILMYSAQIDGWFSILYCNSLASCLTHFLPHWYVKRAPPLVTTVLVSHLTVPPEMWLWMQYMSVYHSTFILNNSSIIFSFSCFVIFHKEIWD